jgi:site-specific DNA-methyltransferase (adenine-specific)
MILTDKIQITNEDNMELMARYPDNYFDLAIVDPPYGIKENSNRINKPKKSAAKKKIYNTSLWSQNKPSKEYFNELMRISNNQIIWGGNYFIDDLYSTRCFIVWDKQSEQSQQVADCELAWTSFEKSVKKFTFRWCGMLQGDMKNKEYRIHPTQKPVKLYEWLLMNYAKEGDKILDTHLGSGSIAIACHNLGFELTACELDEEYFLASIDRFQTVTSQQRLF